ncbi:MAG: hypothetical protein AAB388_03035 [Patescibacteria group bacterium]
MSDLSSSGSFIPKRGAVKHPRTTVKGRVYVFSLLSYIVLFATLLATAAVFLYGQYVQKQLEAEVTAFNDTTRNFNQADLEKVKAFDLRLQQATSRVNNTVSFVSIFDALEASVVGTVRIASLSIMRNADENYVLEASIETNNFDSSLFQRGVFERNDAIDEVFVEELQIADPSIASSDESSSIEPGVTFRALLEVPLGAIPYVPGASTAVVVPPSLPVIEPPESVESEVETDQVNQPGV